AQWTDSRNEFRAPYEPERTGKMPVPLQGAFTLIELLVVISIIAILAAMISTGIRSGSIKAVKAVGLAEMAQVGSAIQEYHDRLGFYPPDNSNDPTMNPLWFELSGTTNNGLNYVTP